MKIFTRLLVLFLWPLIVFAGSPSSPVASSTAAAPAQNPNSPTSSSPAPSSSSTDAIVKRTQQENSILNNPFALSFYQPTYIFPFYYSEFPDNSVYQGNVPDQQTIQRIEIMFQFSIKYPLWRFNKFHSLYLAYTQESFWQAYQGSAFFRETDYQPEIFLSNEINLPLTDGWTANFFNVGAMHQSNGEGGNLERSWNRVYLNAILGKGNLMVGIQPWVIIPDASLHNYNPDIGKYMGYGQLLIAYKYSHQVFSLEARNLVESGFSRGAVQASWSFPLGVRGLKGYVQLFSGYGQSLLEYNHYNNSVGLGINLSDWL